MRPKVLAFFSLLAWFSCLVFVTSVFAQDPVSGTWSGDWGPSPGDRNNVTVALKWDGKALTGAVTGGLNVSSQIPFEKTAFDPKTGTVHMEANAKGRGNSTIHYVIDGKVDKGTMTGSWNHDNRKGDFKLTKK